MKLSRVSQAVAVVTACAGLMWGAQSFAATEGQDAAATSTSAASVLQPIKRGIPDKVYEQGKGPILNLASYNIGAARVSDIETVTKAVGALKADVITLNEVDRLTARSGKVDQVKEIAEALNYNYVFGKTIDFDGGEYGIAILSKFPIGASEIVRLPSGDPKVDEARIVLLAEVQVPGFDNPIVFMNTHLDYKEDHSIQRPQIQCINDLAVANISTHKITDFTTKIKILAGDFNDTYNSENVAELSRYWNLVTSDDPNDMRTWPAANPMADLDHIFTSRGQIWEVKSVEVLGGTDRGIDWNGTSDHNPIVTTLQLVEQ